MLTARVPGGAEDIGGQITEMVIENYHVGESELAAVVSP
jgi:hypothetical protein